MAATLAGQLGAGNGPVAGQSISSMLTRLDQLNIPDIKNDENVIGYGLARRSLDIVDPATGEAMRESLLCLVVKVDEPQVAAMRRRFEGKYADGCPIVVEPAPTAMLDRCFKTGPVPIDTSSLTDSPTLGDRLRSILRSLIGRA